MKFLLLISTLGLALLASSCRVVRPIDPMTGRQSDRCMPDNGDSYRSSK
ncbi:MAG: hypothetical protein HC845_07630 [Akkermansiaceae bacterium]|nr:hypothetical protein [Akkermansiaceae bacterium]